MSKTIIKYKGFEILHRHCFNNVWFSAWKGNKTIFGKEIRMDNRFIDWEDPLSKEEKEFLIKGELI
jgi:hypothetical protein